MAEKPGGAAMFPFPSDQSSTVNPWAPAGPPRRRRGRLPASRSRWVRGTRDSSSSSRSEGGGSGRGSCGGPRMCRLRRGEENAPRRARGSAPPIRDRRVPRGFAAPSFEATAGSPGPPAPAARTFRLHEAVQGRCFLDGFSGSVPRPRNRFSAIFQTVNRARGEPQENATVFANFPLEVLGRGGRRGFGSRWQRRFGMLLSLSVRGGEVPWPDGFPFWSRGTGPTMSRS